MIQAAALSDTTRDTTQEPRILVVDDDLELRDLISGFLGQNGFEVHVAPNGREMDKALARGGISLVVLDYMMPGEDGLSI
ncbi:MAG: response regulator, partial [Reyranella sp.]